MKRTFSQLPKRSIDKHNEALFVEAFDTVAQSKLKIVRQPIVDTSPSVIVCCWSPLEVDVFWLLVWLFGGVRKKTGDPSGKQGTPAADWPARPRHFCIGSRPYVIILNLAFSRRLGQGRIFGRVNPIFSIRVIRVVRVSCDWN